MNVLRNILKSKNTKQVFRRVSVRRFLIILVFLIVLVGLIQIYNQYQRDKNYQKMMSIIDYCISESEKRHRESTIALCKHYESKENCTLDNEIAERLLLVKENWQNKCLSEH